MIGLLAGALPAALAADTEPAGTAARTDVCLEVSREALGAPAWSALVDELGLVVRERSALFPAPRLLESEGVGQDGETAVRRLRIEAGHPAAEPDGAEAALTTLSCLAPGRTWGASLGRSFLDAGADRLLAEAPTTPGIESSVDIDWLADEDRLRTVLVFAGPLDIPNGTCWLDERVEVDPGSGRALVVTEQGVETSPFAEGACRRFFDFLPDGGAGGQAVTLLPTEVAAPDGSIRRLVAVEVEVTQDAVVLGGDIESG